MVKFFTLSTALLLTAAAAPVSAAMLAPTPYLCFDAAAAAGCGTSGSPFADKSYSYFHLETYEDGLQNTPGVTRFGGIVVPPSGNTDSVDADDGAIDGSGLGGHSVFTFGTIGYRFDKAVLGALPTDIGIVFTDGNGGGSNVTLSVFDEAGDLLGSISPFLGADNNNGGNTSDDRFLGWSGMVGVGSFSISAPSLEIDHLQYGLAGAAPGVPEPASWAMMIAGLGLAGAAARRRTGMRLRLA